MFTNMLCNFSFKASFQIIMIIGLHLIPIDFSTLRLKTVSKNFISISWQVSHGVPFKIYYENNFQNVRFQCFAISNNGV